MMTTDIVLIVATLAVAIFWWSTRDWQRRRFDLKFLWPACRNGAPDLNTARCVFARHMAMDPAWRKWADKMSHAELEAWFERTLN